ncbi:hypothetical protein [Breoghania sp. JC706]|uniref:hypothetical protein n=1 Tax=Breoghania sp. JC706 TaxID=3117732 RepID=UPI0030085C92
MCNIGGSKPKVVEPREQPLPADPEKQSASLMEAEKRRRAAAYGRSQTRLTGPLGVSDYGQSSQGAVTLLGRA